MRAILRSLPCLVLAFAAAAAEQRAVDQLPEYHASDASAAPVGAADLLRNDRFWPYRVTLRSAWSSTEPTRVIPAGSTGVLIRVEDGGRARVDFGRDGIHSVPVAETDLVESVNRVRLGELPKMAPNFVLAIGPRLLDSTAEPLVPVRLMKVSAQRGFVTVFATLEQLEPISRVLSPLADRNGVMTIVLPEGEHRDVEVRDRLRELAWPVPFVYDHLAEVYTPSLLPENIAPPAIMLQTAEGRVLFQSTWGKDAGEKLSAAMDAAFGGPGPK